MMPYKGQHSAFLNRPLYDKDKFLYHRLRGLAELGLWPKYSLLSEQILR